MRRWIVFCCGLAVLGGAAWYFGKPAEAPVIVVAPPQAAVAEAPKSAPPKVIEVIDLARAYEPVREEAPVYPGGVNPASFIEMQTAPPRIPYAVSNDAHLFRDLFMAIRRTPLGVMLLGPAGPRPERIETIPREVDDPFARILRIVHETPSGSFPIGLQIPERLDVMPREVVGPTQDLLHWLVEFGWM
jgi:hypothetical protein